MSASSRSPDRFATTFDHEGLVANAGLLAGTLMDRLGLSGLIAVGAHRFYLLRKHHIFCLDGDSRPA